VGRGQREAIAERQTLSGEFISTGGWERNPPPLRTGRQSKISFLRLHDLRGKIYSGSASGSPRCSLQRGKREKHPARSPPGREGGGGRGLFEKIPRGTRGRFPRALCPRERWSRKEAHSSRRDSVVRGWIRGWKARHFRPSLPACLPACLPPPRRNR